MLRPETSPHRPLAPWQKFTLWLVAFVAVMAGMIATTMHIDADRKRARRLDQCESPSKARVLELKRGGP